MTSCVLAYSGGLDTSVILGWLKDEGYEVHCVYVDLGQPCEDRAAIQEKAKRCGAASARIVAGAVEWRDERRSPRSILFRFALAIPVASVLLLPSPRYEWIRLQGQAPNTKWPLIENTAPGGASATVVCVVAVIARIW